MEDFIVYVIIAVAIIVNVVRNYKKEQEKNKARNLTQQPNLGRSTSTLPDVITPRPFSRTTPPSEFTFEQETVEGRVIELPEEILNESIIDYPSLENTNANVIDVPLYQSLEIEKEPFAIEVSSEESIAFGDGVKNDRINLKLDTQEDLKKAFIYSLVFERKY